MVRTRFRSTVRGFTILELLVAICVSVVLLVVLAFVFKVSAGATRDANSRVGMTERLRLLNIRMRQEVGSMQPIPRLDPGKGNTKPYTDGRTFDVASDGTWIMFATSTTENGLPVNVDVRYQLIQDPGGDPHKNVLVRWRDHTGPHPYTSTGQFSFDASGKNLDGSLHQYVLGDNSFETGEGNGKWAAPPNPGSQFLQSDVLLQNVRSVKFDVTSMDVPSGMPFNDNTSSPSTPSLTDLYPRQLPAGVQLDVEYGPDQGDLDKTEKVRLCFTVYRGL